MKATLSKTVIPGATKFRGGIKSMNSVLKICGLVLITSLLSTRFVYGQRADTTMPRSTGDIHNLYRTEHKRNNTVTRLLLIPVATIVTTRIFKGNNLNNTSTGGLIANKESKIDFLGTAMALTSIPFFISACNKRRKAYLSLTTGTIAITRKGPGNFSFLAVTLKIKI